MVEYESGCRDLPMGHISPDSALTAGLKSSLVARGRVLPPPEGAHYLGWLTQSSFQILIQIVDASSVITWDFDVCKGDIVFNIYHSKRSPQPPKKDSLGAHSITSPGGNNVQLIDRAWQLGRDYSMVESPLICKEGESVQVQPRGSLQRSRFSCFGKGKSCCIPVLLGWRCVCGRAVRCGWF